MVHVPDIRDILGPVVPMVGIEAVAACPAYWLPQRGAAQDVIATVMVGLTVC